MKMNKKIGITFIIVIVVINLISLTLMNKLNHNSFSSYIENEEEEVIYTITNYIKEDFLNPNINLPKTLDDYSDTENVYIKISSNGRTIYESDSVRQHMGMHNMSMHMNKNQAYREREVELNVDNITLNITIGQLTQSINSTSAVTFINQLNFSHLISFIISLVIAIIATLIISNHFSNPIMLLNNNLKHISKGSYSKFEDIKSSTYEINQLNISSKQIKNSLQEQEMIRETLITNLSHDLRTPLTVIKTNLEGMSDGLIEINRENLEIASNRLDRIISIVKQLDQLTNISDEDIKQSTANISEETLATIELFNSEAKTKNITINSDIEEDLLLYINIDYYNQIIQNLISNAIKYNKQDGEINISLFKNKEKIHLIIEDTGIGIEESDLPYIFDRFYRCDKSRFLDNSSGVGLAIVKSLVQLNNGDINVRSEYGVGTTFDVQFNIKEKTEWRKF